MLVFNLNDFFVDFFDVVDALKIVNFFNLKRHMGTLKSKMEAVLLCQQISSF